MTWHNPWRLPRASRRREASNGPLLMLDGRTLHHPGCIQTYQVLIIQICSNQEMSTTVSSSIQYSPSLGAPSQAKPSYLTAWDPGSTWNTHAFELGPKNINSSSAIRCSNHESSCNERKTSNISNISRTWTIPCDLRSSRVLVWVKNSPAVGPLGPEWLGPSLAGRSHQPSHSWQWLAYRGQFLASRLQGDNLSD